MKKFALEVQQVTFGEDDVQSPEEVEKIFSGLGRFYGVEQVDENTYRICFQELEQADGSSGYYWIDVKVKKTEN